MMYIMFAMLDDYVFVEHRHNEIPSRFCWHSLVPFGRDVVGGCLVPEELNISIDTSGKAYLRR